MLDDLAATAGGVTNTLGIDTHINADGSSELLDNIRATASGASEALDDGSLIYNSIDRARGLNGPAGMVADMLLPSRPTATEDQEGGAIEPDPWGQDIVSAVGIGLPALLDKAAAATTKSATSAALKELAKAKDFPEYADDLADSMRKVEKWAESDPSNPLANEILNTLQMDHYSPETIAGRVDTSRLGIPVGTSREAIEAKYLNNPDVHETWRRALGRATEMKYGSRDEEVVRILDKMAKRNDINADISVGGFPDPDAFGWSFADTGPTGLPVSRVSIRTKVLDDAGYPVPINRLHQINTGRHEIIGHGGDYQKTAHGNLELLEEMSTKAGKAAHFLDGTPEFERIPKAIINGMWDKAREGVITPQADYYTFKVLMDEIEADLARRAKRSLAK
jgi:hypothetical protein